MALILSVLAIALSFVSLRGQYRRSHACGGSSSSAAYGGSYLPGSQPQDYDSGSGGSGNIRLGVSDLGPRSGGGSSSSSSLEGCDIGIMRDNPMRMELPEEGWQ
jgi:hypothetical protein